MDPIHHLFNQVLLEEEETNSSHSSFVQQVNHEINRIDEHLEKMDNGLIKIRNKQRKRKRLLAKKEKMKIRIQLAIRDSSQGLMSPSEKRTLAYYSRKFGSEVEESDHDFLYRVLCTELGLTLEDWFSEGNQF